MNYLDFDRYLIGQDNEQAAFGTIVRLALVERALVGARSGLLGIAH